jgi:hypothetical protein
MSNFDLVIQLFLQLTVILTTCRIVTILGRRYLAFLLHGTTYDKSSA